MNRGHKCRPKFISITYSTRPNLMAFDLDPDDLVQDEGLLLGMWWQHFRPPPR